MLQTLEDLSIAVWVRESPSLFAYTLVLSLHAIGLAIVLGTNSLIALRLLGVATAIPLTALRNFYGFIWLGFVVNAVSGLLLFVASANTMGTMPAFWAKMILVFTGMTVALRLKSRYLDSPTLASGTVPDGARSMAKVSLVVWCLALIVGRLTGYPELIASWFGTWASGL
jgi:hypothetical protein